MGRYDASASLKCDRGLSLFYRWIGNSFDGWKYEMIQRFGIGDEVTPGEGGEEMGVKKVSGNTTINAARILYASEFFFPFLLCSLFFHFFFSFVAG